MKRSFGTTLFLVASPFQCLCLLEAIRHFKIGDYEVMVIYSDKYSLAKIDTLLKRNNISYTKKRVAHLFFDVMPFFFTKHNYYKNIFIGDLNSRNFFAIAYIFASFRANIYVLDDGNQALSFFSSTPRKINYKLSIRLVLFFYDIIRIVKFVKRPIFFTIFNVESNKYKIVNNPMSLLKTQELNEQSGVYIIGTNSSMLVFKDFTYEEYLTRLHKLISFRYPADNIFYCPHRRDSNQKKIQSLCEQLNISVFDAKIAIEYDFIEKKVNPKLIVGFTSNALYTLKIIYPNSIVETIMYTLISDVADQEIRIIRSRMEESGITTLNVFQ